MTCKLCEDYKDQIETRHLTSIKYVCTNYKQDLLSLQILQRDVWECKFCKAAFYIAYKEDKRPGQFKPSDLAISPPTTYTWWERFIQYLNFGPY